MQQTPDLWLIRTNENLIAGPYPGEQIRKLILDKTLTPQDEICQANKRWLVLTHVDEAEKLLSFEFPKDWFKPDDQGVTEITRTQMDDETFPGTPTPHNMQLPDVPELEEFEGTDTALLRSRAFRTLQTRKQARLEGRPFGPQMEVTGGSRNNVFSKVSVEKMKIIRSVIYVLFALIAIAVTVLIQVIRR